MTMQSSIPSIIAIFIVAWSHVEHNDGWRLGRPLTIVPPEQGNTHQQKTALCLNKNHTDVAH